MEDLIQNGHVKFNENNLLEPLHYLVNIPGKKIRTKLIKVSPKKIILNQWKLIVFDSIQIFDYLIEEFF